MKQAARTRVIKITARGTGTRAVEEAVAVMKAGGVIGFPTDTVYGLGADARNEDAIREMYSLKGRSPGKPTSILIHSKDLLPALVKETSRGAQLLADAFWPGPLTIIFKARPSISRTLTGNTGTIGIRIPGSNACLRILRAAGFPVTAPSANPEGASPACSAQEVLEYFDGRLRLIIDGGEANASSPSTIVEAAGSKIKVLREGVIGRGLIEKTAGGSF